MTGAINDEVPLYHRAPQQISNLRVERLSAKSLIACHKAAFAFVTKKMQVPTLFRKTQKIQKYLVISSYHKNNGQARVVGRQRRSMKYTMKKCIEANNDINLTLLQIRSMPVLQDWNISPHYCSAVPSEVWCQGYWQRKLQNITNFTNKKQNSMLQRMFLLSSSHITYGLWTLDPWDCNSMRWCKPQWVILQYGRPKQDTS